MFQMVLCKVGLFNPRQERSPPGEPTVLAKAPSVEKGHCQPNPPKDEEGVKARGEKPQTSACPIQGPNLGSNFNPEARRPEEIHDGVLRVGEHTSSRSHKTMTRTEFSRRAVETRGTRALRILRLNRAFRSKSLLLRPTQRFGVAGGKWTSVIAQVTESQVQLSR